MDEFLVRSVSPSLIRRIVRSISTCTKLFRFYRYVFSHYVFTFHHVYDVLYVWISLL